MAESGAYGAAGLVEGLPWSMPGMLGIPGMLAWGAGEELGELLIECPEGICGWDEAGALLGVFIVDMSSPHAVTERARVAVTAAVVISRLEFMGSSFGPGFSVGFSGGLVWGVGLLLRRRRVAELGGLVWCCGV